MQSERAKASRSGSRANEQAGPLGECRSARKRRSRKKACQTSWCSYAPQVTLVAALSRQQSSSCTFLPNRHCYYRSYDHADAASPRTTFRSKSSRYPTNLAGFGPSISTFSPLLFSPLTSPSNLPHTLLRTSLHLHRPEIRPLPI